MSGKAYTFTSSNGTWNNTNLWVPPNDGTIPGQNDPTPNTGDEVSVPPGTKVTSALLNGFNLGLLSITGGTVQSTAPPSKSVGVLTIGNSGKLQFNQSRVVMAGAVQLGISGTAGIFQGNSNTYINTLQCSSLDCQDGGMIGYDATHGDILTCSGNATVRQMGYVFLNDGTSTVGGSLTVESGGTLTTKTAGQALTLTGSGTISMSAGGTYTNLTLVIAASGTETLSGNIPVPLTLTSGIMATGGTHAITGAFTMGGGTLNMDVSHQINPSTTAAFIGGTLNVSGTGTAGTKTLMTTTTGIIGTPTLGTVPTGFTGSLAVVGKNLVLTLTAVSSGPACYSITEIGGSKANNGIIEVG
jgi:hypothetical protein